MPDLTSRGALSPPADATADELVDTVLAASRALIAVAACPLAAAGDEVTLPQYRAQVVLAARGPLGTAELAAALAVNPSTVTRMCDRLVRKGLIRRHRQAGDRRSVRITLTAAGRWSWLLSWPESWTPSELVAGSAGPDRAYPA